jgi:epoxyqueuosine reductase
LPEDAAHAQRGPVPPEQSATAEARTRAIRARALELGFHKVGVARAGKIDREDRLAAWLHRGHAGTMDYLTRTAAERADVTVYMPGARSVVALAVSYHRPEHEGTGPLKVARYALGDDYHRVLKRKVQKLRRFVLQLDPSAQVAPTVDTSPVLERAWAQEAGIAWIGKSTMAIAQDLGTYTFLATLVTTLELVPDAPHPDRCGSCTACLDACPTQAFVGPRELDATRCITYWTVEERRAALGSQELHGWVAGCDVCQDVCPWNKFARPADEPRFRPRPGLAAPDPALFTDPAQHGALAALLDGTALARTGAAAIRRNARHALGLEPLAPAEDAPDLGDPSEATSPG